MRHIILALFVVLPGIVGVIVFGYFALVDWNILQKDYTYFVSVVQGSSDLKTLFAAEAQQNIHRINLFAEGIWTLLSAILATLGILAMLILGVRRNTGRM